MDNLKITEDDLKMIVNKIEHLVRFAAGENGLRKSESGELYGVNGSPYNNLEPGEKVEGSVLLAEIEVQFNTGGPKFNPTADEVVSQIPTPLLPFVSGYEIVSNDTQKAQKIGGSVAVVNLYKYTK